MQIERKDAGLIEHRDFGLIEVKLAGDDTGTFSGYGAVFGNVDGHGDVIEHGAFADSLAEWKSRGKWPKMLLQHGGFGLGSDDMMPVGQWTEMREDRKGLKVDGRLFAMNTERGQYIYEGLKSGELDSLSIGYQTEDSRSETRDGDHVRVLTKIKLWEVSIVTFPANDKARISSVKTLTLEELRELEAKLRDGGLSQREAVTASAIFKKWLRRDAAAPISNPRDEGVPGADDVLKSLSRLTDSTWSGVFKA
jgi:HK97 family phage prohead protease